LEIVKGTASGRTVEDPEGSAAVLKTGSSTFHFRAQGLRSYLKISSSSWKTAKKSSKGALKLKDLEAISKLAVHLGRQRKKVPKVL
jgi:hypothetical protein